MNSQACYVFMYRRVHDFQHPLQQLAQRAHTRYAGARYTTADRSVRTYCVRAAWNLRS